MADKCRGCGKPILWGVDLTGRPIPLDNTVPIYRLERHFGKQQAVRDEHCYVSHFVTCRSANDFSNKGKPRKPQQLEMGAAEAPKG